MNKASILKKFIKDMPEGSFFKLSEETPNGVVPSGISTLDYALGIGGFARGWQTLIYGASSTGKSAMVLQAIGNYQKEHPESLAAVIDLEKSMTTEWAVKFGIDPERLFVMRPVNVEEMITATMECVQAKIFDFIMVDSLGAGLLKTEIENDKTRMAGSAGAITRMVKAVNSAFISLERDIKVAKDNGDDTSDMCVPAVILINQVRVDLSSMYATETYSGGKALTHMMGAIIHLRTSKATAEKIVGTVDGIQMRVGWQCSATVEKNKLATPGKSAGYSFVFKECPEHPFGIDNARSVADLALATGTARVEGKTIYYPTPDGEEGKIVGRNHFNELVHDDPKLLEFLAEEISRKTSENYQDEELEIVKELHE